MPVLKKTDDIRYGDGATISNDVKSHANDPFVVEKTAEAKIAVSKLVLPIDKNK